MEHPNIYTFKHSALPPIDDAIKGEIAEIDFAVANLILKFQGHYRALSELRETLNDLLDSCELNLQCIRIVPDGDDNEAAPRAIGLTDLSQRQKELIAAQVLGVSAAAEILCASHKCTYEEALSHILAVAGAAHKDISDEQVNEIIGTMDETLTNPTGNGAVVAMFRNPITKN